MMNADSFEVPYGLGRTDDALRQYRRVVELAPGNAGDWNYLVVTEIGAGDKAGARRDLQKAALLDPANEAVRNNLLAWALTKPQKDRPALLYGRSGPVIQGQS